MYSLPSVLALASLAVAASIPPGVFPWQNTTVDYQNTTASFHNITARYHNITARYHNTTARYQNTTVRYQNTTARYQNTTAKLQYRNTALAPRQNTTGKLQYVGTNIAGFDFGCTTDGTCDVTKAVPPLTALNGPDGAGQMSHFVNDDHFNIFRLPVGWQWLVNNNLGGTLDAAKLGQYDQLVQACLATGAACIVDIHNYARFDGKVVGSAGGPTDDQFVSLWTQLASRYGGDDRVLFGLMNEPHDLPSVAAWAATVQKVVTAIRSASSSSANNTILLPGSSYSSAATLPTEAGPALLNVTNPDGTTDGLVFDVHKYLDADNSGTHTECTTDNVSGAFAPLADWLRKNGRQALNTETGGGNTQSCETDLCAQVAYLRDNADVFLGVVGWAAGAFDATYELVETPTRQGSGWADTALVKACLTN